MYEIWYHPRSLKFLSKIPKNERDKVLLRLNRLQENPFVDTLNIKKLADSKKSYRVRIGKIRAIFELDERKKIIYVNAIDFRGNIY